MKTEKNIFYSLTVLVTAGALSIAATGTAVAAEAAPSKVETNQAITVNYAGELNQAELEMAFQLIESIPDSALKDEKSFEQWKNEHLQIVGQPRASVGACAWGITKALAANIFVFSKVAKLRTVIKAAGVRKL